MHLYSVLIWMGQTPIRLQGEAWQAQEISSTLQTCSRQISSPNEKQKGDLGIVASNLL